ncbi:M1 family metallopeptidase [Inquilinus sp. KBS0705]|nr:M1 family metallopeptidase [Inquilinus sp. KBS0705]
MRKSFLILTVLAFTQFAKAQQPGAVIDVQHYKFAITLNDADNNIKGTAGITLKFLKSTNKFTFDLAKKNAAGKGMLITSLKENGKPLHFVQDSDKVEISAIGKVNTTHTYVIKYEGIPSDGLIISTNKHGHRTFFGDNWPNRGHNWLPLADHPADKASVEFIVTAPAHYQVIANGLKTEEKALPKKQKLTHWKETARLPTKVMVIGVADFAIDRPGTPNGIPVYTYVFPEDKAVGFKNYAVATKVIPFYSEKIDPFAYKKLANVQSKTIFGGMENAGAIFYYENSVLGQGIEPLMAHEIAHQYFGDAVSEKDWPHVWLSEGFATYMTNCYMESRYGVDTLKAAERADRKTALSFEKQYKAPVVDTAYKGALMNILSANPYQKGGWVLHMLRRKIGDGAFWKGISTYYKKYSGANANTDDFRVAMEQASGQDLKVFFKQWLRTAGHPDLDINWKYNPATSSVDIQVEQQQDALFTFPLEISVNGKVYKSDISQKTTAIAIASTTAQNTVLVDPNVNLFASYIVNGEKK